MAHSHKPMSGDGYAPGYYSDNTIGCYNVIMNTKNLVVESLESVLKHHQYLPENEGEEEKKLITLADFGTADGGTSMPLFYDLCGHIHSLFSSPPPIQVFYEDQPINVWRDLFMRLHHIIDGPPSYLLDFENVFVSTVGRSFYEQCLAPNSVHLMFSFTAMHWLSTPPLPFNEKIHHTLVLKDGVDSQRLEEHKIQAQKDWAKILKQRYKELVEGGRMVFVNFCVDDKGQCLGNTERVQVKMWQKFNDLWDKMRNDGLITEEEHKKCSFANYYRTLEEFKAPFSPSSSSSSSDLYVDGLELVSIESKEVACPYHEKWMKEKHNQNPTEEEKKEHAKWYVPTLRTWSNSTFYDALDTKRGEQERKDLINQFFQFYEDDVAKDPSLHAMDYVHAYVVVEKKKKE